MLYFYLLNDSTNFISTNRCICHINAHRENRQEQRKEHRHKSVAMRPRAFECTLSETVTGISHHLEAGLNATNICPVCDETDVLKVVVMISRPEETKEVKSRSTHVMLHFHG